MQIEIRVRRRASPAVFGAGDVSLPAHPTQRLLCLAEESVEQAGPEDARQTELIRTAWKDSGKVYGYRKLHDDLLDQGETCCPNRVARLASLAGIKAQIGYKRRPGSHGGKPSLVVDNTLDRQFDVDAPDRVWVTDITYIRTLEGFAYLAVIIDLYSRRVVGWSMQSRQTTDVVLQALLMAVWRRKPKEQGADPFGSGFPVHQHGLGLIPQGSQSGTLDEPARKLPRQRCCRELLQSAQAGADTAPDLQDPRRGQAGRVRLHRDVLQPETQARQERDAVTRRVRTAAGNENRGRENSGLFFSASTARILDETFPT
jgi:transposase InsO family protein